MVNLLDKILKIVLILIVVGLYMYANNQNKGKDNMSNNDLMELLEEEIESGVSISCEGGEGVGVEVDRTYYKLSSQVFNEKLKQRGFKFLSEKEFTQKVFKIFKIDLKKSIQIVDMADISMEYEDEFPSAQSEGGVGLKVFDKQNGLITKIYRLPEIINYQKYEKLNILEKKNKDDFNENDCSIYWWKEFYEDIDIDEKINSEVENIMALNNYLFYNQGSIDRLFKDNHYFFSHLVLSNNYYTDLDLLEKVLDDIIDNAPNDFGKLLWKYNKHDGLLINEGAFNIILKKPKERKKKFLEQMKVEKNNLYNQSMNKEERIRLNRILENALHKNERY